MTGRITGRQIVVALKGTWHAGKGMCVCPAHDDSPKTPSLSVREVPDRILLHCFAHCEFQNIVDHLRSRGLWPARDDDGYRAKVSRPLHRASTASADPDEIAKAEAARQIWQKAQPIAGTAAALYLWSRGINTKKLPPTLRAVPELYHREEKKTYPALVGALQNSAGRVTSVQRIWVTAKLQVEDNGQFPVKGTKAPISAAKKTLGPMEDGAIRLGRAARTLGLAEGLETGLSAQELFSIPVWVSCGAWRMSGIAIPDDVERIILFGDNGDAGMKAAEKAHDHFSAQGYAVEAEFPPPEFSDWNDFHVAPKRVA